MSDEIKLGQLAKGEYLVSRSGNRWERLQVVSDGHDQHRFWLIAMYDRNNRCYHGCLRWEHDMWRIYYPGMEGFVVKIKKASISPQPVSHVRRVEL